MGFEDIAHWTGEKWLGPAGGFAIGILFGFMAQRSGFCLRAASIETARAKPGDRLAIWLTVFSVAVVATQGLILLGLFDTGTVRQINSQGSLSGSIAGGLMFGVGMILTRACASRMLVLSGTGNLRALLAGLVFAVVALASRNGILAPLRGYIGELWTISPANRDLLAATHLGNSGAVIFGALWLATGLFIAWRSNAKPWQLAAAAATGLSVAAAWWFTFNEAAISFDPVPVHSLSFAGPSADMLNYVLTWPDGVTFDLFLIPGVFFGAFLAGAAAGELKLEGFQGAAGMPRYILGGGLMGFGAMLAGGCAVGAGVSGASVFSATAWIVLWSIWIGAAVTDRLVDAPMSER
jgi:uncharacterized membrane protein YedE/YeeE